MIIHYLDDKENIQGPFTLQRMMEVEWSGLIHEKTRVFRRDPDCWEYWGDSKWRREILAELSPQKREVVEPRESVYSDPPQPVKAVDNTELYLKATVFGLFLLMFFFPAARPWNWISASPYAESQPTKPETISEVEAMGRAKVHVKKLARDPDSVKFNSVNAHDGSGDWVVILDVSGKNGFGGMARTIYSIEIDHKSGKIKSATDLANQ